MSNPPKLQLPKRLVVSRRSLPAKLVWTEGAVLYLLLAHWHAPAWVYVPIAVGWAIVLLWRGYQQMRDKPVDLWPADQWYTPLGGDPVRIDPGAPEGDRSVPMRDVETPEGPDRVVAEATPDVAPTNLERGHT